MPTEKNNKSIIVLLDTITNKLSSAFYRLPLRFVIVDEPFERRLSKDAISIRYESNPHIRD